MVERGKILYQEKRKILGIKTRMFIPLAVIILIFIGVLFYISIESGDIACFAPTIFISLVLIGIMTVLIMRLSDRFTIYENGIQFSDSAILQSHSCRRNEKSRFLNSDDNILIPFDNNG